MADSAVPTPSICPKCSEPLEAQARVCRHCLHIVDRAAWEQHDAGRLGADDRGGGRPIEDPPVGPIPLTGSGVAGGDLGGAGAAAGSLASGLRLITTALLARPRRRREERRKD
jgi:hypothetical protein